MIYHKIYVDIIAFYDDQGCQMIEASFLRYFH